MDNASLNNSGIFSLTLSNVGHILSPILLLLVLLPYKSYKLNSLDDGLYESIQASFRYHKESIS